MVKRVKLTLDHQEAAAQSTTTTDKEPVVEKKSEAAKTDPMPKGQQSNLGKILIITGLTIAFLVLFRRKIL